MIIPNLVCVLFDPVIPTSSFNLFNYFLYLYHNRITLQVGMVLTFNVNDSVLDDQKTRAHGAHTPRAMAISPMAMPLLRGLYSLNFNLLLLMHERFHSLLRSMITSDIRSMKLEHAQ